MEAEADPGGFVKGGLAMVEQRLRELGYTLPESVKPAAVYVPGFWRMACCLLLGNCP